jgi:hypothetical protein
MNTDFHSFFAKRLVSSLILFTFATEFVHSVPFCGIAGGKGWRVYTPDFMGIIEALCFYLVRET